MLAARKEPFRSFVALLVSVPASASAQEVAWRAVGLDHDAMGFAVDAGLDVTGDQVGDVIAGGQSAGASHGVIDVYDGRSGAIVFELLGSKSDDHFGGAVALVPDLDGDGRAEFLVGARLNDWKDHDAGSAYLYSGADARLLHAFRGELVNGRFGIRVSVAGDVNEDGATDFAIASEGDWTKGQNVGAVFVYSGADFSLIRTIYGQGKNQPFFGRCLADAGDVDADGLPDLIAGSPVDDDNGANSGTIAIYSGADGHAIHTLSGAVGTLFGESACGVGDLDRDGHADFLVGAIAVSGPFTTCGRAVIYSGADAHVLREHFGTSAGARLGTSCGNVGDADSDGFDDYAIADLSDFRGLDCGAAWLFSGRTGRLLYRHDGLAALDDIRVASHTGDVDGDGRPDVVLGSPGYDAPRENLNGWTAAYRGYPLKLQFDPDDASSGAAIDGDVRGGAPFALCVVAVTILDGMDFYATVAFTTLDGNGELHLSATAPAGLFGHVFTLQAFADDPSLQQVPPVVSNPEAIRFL